MDSRHAAIHRTDGHTPREQKSQRFARKGTRMKRRMTRRTIKGSAGFTLLEVLIALIITVAAGILLSTAWSGNLLRVRKTTLNDNVAQLLQRKIAEIKAENSKKKFTDIHHAKICFTGSRRHHGGATGRRQPNADNDADKDARNHG